MIAPNTPPDGPSNNGTGKGAGGRFLPGNKLGRGNPHAARTHKLRSATFKFATVEKHLEVVEQLFQKCLDGDMDAIKEWMNRTLGKSLQQVEHNIVQPDPVHTMTTDEFEDILRKRAGLNAEKN